jgi:hypothetical protein
MTQMTPAMDVRAFRTRPKDIGVALVIVVALALGLLLRSQVTGRTNSFKDKDSPFSVTYPATWGTSESLLGLLLKVQDTRTDSIFKTTLSVERRALDPQSPPTLQALVDRRVATQGAQTAFHLLSTTEATVGGAKAMRQEYAYVVQPIDQARRASVPVVVHAIDYVVVTKDNAYFITLAAPEGEFDGAAAQMDSIISSVKVQ